MSFFEKDDGTVNKKYKDSINSSDAFDGEKGVTTHSVIKQKEELLTFLGTWRHKGFKSIEAEKQIITLTRKVIQAQTDYLDSQLKVGLDKRKKEDYVKYLEEIQSINENIVKISSSAATRLIKASLDIDSESFKYQREQIDRFTNMYKENKITLSQLEKQIQKIESSTIKLQHHGEMMVDKILTSSIETFNTTIKLFDENKIKTI